MIKRITIGNLRITLTAARIDKVIGVNSNLPDGNHILMWDFDDVELDKVLSELHRVQSAYNLPKIIVLSSGTPKHWMAYCFKSSKWLDAMRVIVNTNYVDLNFIRFSVYRSHFTLRVTPKHGKRPVLETVLRSKERQNCTIEDLESWVRYETVRKG